MNRNISGVNTHLFNLGVPAQVRQFKQQLGTGLLGCQLMVLPKQAVAITSSSPMKRSQAAADILLADNYHGIQSPKGRDLLFRFEQQADIFRTGNYARQQMIGLYGFPTLLPNEDRDSVEKFSRRITGDQLISGMAADFNHFQARSLIIAAERIFDGPWFKQIPKPVLNSLTGSFLAERAMDKLTGLMCLESDPGGLGIQMFHHVFQALGGDVFAVILSGK